MGIVLAVSRLYLPNPVRCVGLNQLFTAAGDAFQCEVPSLKGLSPEQCLAEFARFTRENADNSICQGSEQEVKGRLYQNAYRMGQRIRNIIKIRTLKDIFQVGEVIYKALNIEFHGDTQGNIVIPNCYFSLFYSASVCRIISGLDEGLLAGLSGGLCLTFTQRITAGETCCRARLEAAGAIS